MKKLTIVTLIAVFYCSFLFSQTDEKLKSDIRNTGYVHFPLPLDYSKSFETFGLTKKVLVSDMLCDMEDMNKWSHKGIGDMRQTSERSISGKNSLRIVAPTVVNELPTWGLGRGTSMAT
jgi:hypothetical protein